MQSELLLVQITATPLQDCRNSSRRSSLTQQTMNEPTASDQETDPESSPGPTNLKPSQKKALDEFKARLEEAILSNHVFHSSDKGTSTDKGSYRKNKSPLAKTRSSLRKIKSPLRKTKSDIPQIQVPPEPGPSNSTENFERISLWGVPLLASEGHGGTNVVLLKFLRARDFKVSDALEMLVKTLKWRKELKIDGILEENLRPDLQNAAAYMKGVDRDGHPLCYNVGGYFRDKDLYNKTFGTEDRRQEFLRWRIQVMEKGIKELSFEPGAASSMVQIIDLKNSPGPARRELKNVSKEMLMVLQDNYPEFVARNIFINVSFKYYASQSLFGRLLSHRTKSRCVCARPSKTAETLLRYIDPENLPVEYGGFRREEDDEFFPENGRVSEKTIKAGASKAIEIQVPEPGVTVVWDMSVVGWEVSYKEEFIPDDDCSYKILIRKERKMEKTVRNSFHISEPGKVVLTISNHTLKKKRFLYRTKTKPTIPLYNLFKT